MTRIESKPPSEDRESLKREIVGEIRHAEIRRKALGCGACALVWLVIILGGFWFVGSRIAKTGIMKVPLFSDSQPVAEKPIRQVAPLLGTKPEDVPRIVGANARYDQNTSSLSVPIKESALTTIVNSALVSGSVTLPFQVKSAQVAIEPKYVELFVISPQEGKDVTVRARFTPKVDAGQLDFDVVEVKLGSLVLPQSVGSAMFGAIRGPLNDAITSATNSSGGKLKDVSLATGSMTLVFTVVQK